MFNKLKKKIDNHFNRLLESKLKENNKELIVDIKRLIKASIVNRETFGPFKDYCKGKKLVICGAGPSLNKYKPIPGAVHIALNRAFLFNKVHFDFIFCMDFGGLINYQKEFKDYPCEHKLIGNYGNNNDYYLPQAIEETVRSVNAKRWYIDPAKHFDNDNDIYFEKDIDITTLCDFPQVGLAVLQFALFMNPKDIYLVGYDQSGGHFNKDKLKNDTATSDLWFQKTHNCQVACWKRFIEFKNYHYPSIKIHSINPVGLKGLFDDITQ